MKRRSVTISLAIALLMLAAIMQVGCSARAARRGEPIGKPIQLVDRQEIHGEQVFMFNCHRCHPNGEAGLGPALNNKALPTFAIKFQVRNGLGAMPSFTEEELSDQDLDAVVAYVHALRESGETPRK